MPGGGGRWRDRSGSSYGLGFGTARRLKRRRAELSPLAILRRRRGYNIDSTGIASRGIGGFRVRDEYRRRLLVLVACGIAHRGRGEGLAVAALPRGMASVASGFVPQSHLSKESLTPAPWKNASV